VDAKPVSPARHYDELCSSRWPRSSHAKMMIAGSVNGRVRAVLIPRTFWSENSSMRIEGLHSLQIADGDQWRPAYPAPDNPERNTYLRQLDNLAAMLDGQHTRWRISVPPLQLRN